MKIILVLLFSILLNAGNLTTQNEIKLTSFNGEFNNDYETIKTNIEKISYNSYIKYTSEYFSFNGVFELNKFSELPESYKNVSLKYNDENLVTKSAMVGLKYSDVSIYYGVLPFTGGYFKTFKNDDILVGNGIELIIDQVLIGSFITYKIDNLTLKYGIAEWNKNTNYNSLLPKNDTSNGQYAILTYVNKNNYFEINYFNIKPKMDQDTNEPYDLGKLDLFAVGYIYTGYDYSFSVEGAFSSINENIESTRQSYIPDIYKDYFESLGYLVDNKKTEGYAFKVQTKRNFELFDRDGYIGLEYFKTYDGFISMNHGVLFNSNYSYWQNRNADQLTLFGSLYINKNVLINMNISYSESNNVPRYFSIAESEPIENSISSEDYYIKNLKSYINLSIRF